MHDRLNRPAVSSNDLNSSYQRMRYRSIVGTKVTKKRLIRRLLTITAVFTAIFPLLLLAAPRIESVDKPTVSIYFLDVGQGDAALVQTADGKNLLIDAGPADSSGRIINRLSTLGVTSLDAFVLTHPHADHLGGALAIIKRFPAKAVLDPGYAHTSTTYAEFLEYVEKNGVAYRQPRKGLTIKLGVHAKFDVLAPEDPFLSGTRSDANSNSVVMVLHVGDVRVMLTGDAEADTERRLLRAQGTQDLDVDVLKVAHHGSAHSSTDAFLSLTKPEVAIISCAASNRYGHPAPEALSRLSAVGAEIFVTANFGDIIVHTDGQNYSVDSLNLRNTVGSQPSDKKVPPTFNAPAGPPAGGGAPLPAASESPRGLDINIASQEDFATLPGIGPAKASAIVQLRDSKGGFGSVDDLRSVKGIGAKTFEQLRPLVYVGGQEEMAPSNVVAAAVQPQNAQTRPTMAPTEQHDSGVDLNGATQADLQSLPGIGPVKAASILQYRTQVGGFTSVDQLVNVKGIGVKTLESLRPFVHVGSGVFSPPSAESATQPLVSTGGRVELNSATEEDLRTLPGIGPAKARAIIDYRTTVGRFVSIDQLTDVKGIGAKTLEQLRPLVAVEPSRQ